MGAKGREEEEGMGWGGGGGGGGGFGFGGGADTPSSSSSSRLYASRTTGGRLYLPSQGAMWPPCGDHRIVFHYRLSSQGLRD